MFEGVIRVRSSCQGWKVIPHCSTSMFQGSLSKLVRVVRIYTCHTSAHTSIR